jgi:predicted TPR repeat methyltransferase
MSEAYLEKAVQFIKDGKFHKAEAILQKVLEVDQRHPGALYLLGVTANALGNNDLSLKALKEAALIAPRFAEVYNHLSIVYQELDRLHDAIDCLKKVIELQPDNVMAHNNIGSLLRVVGNRTEAINSFNIAISLNKKMPELYNNKGITHQELGQLDESLTCYRKALELKPDFVHVYNNLGNTLQDMGRIDEAIKSYQQCIELDSTIAEVHKNLASAFQSQGLWSNAIPYYQQALSLNPRFTSAMGGLGNALKHLGRFDEAAQQFKLALEIDPSLDDIRHLLASVEGETTYKAPKQYVEKLFDNFAGNFEHHLVKTLDYNAPKHLRDVVKKCVGSQPFYKNAVDLGCGTGLLGKEFRDVVGNLIGIDLSKKMIQQATHSKIYNQLLVGDIEETLNGLDKQFDLCMSSDVFPYVGDLQSVFQAVKHSMSTNGQFLFLTEHYDDSGYVLNINGRYAHSVGYIRQIAVESGFTIKHIENVVFRFDQVNEVYGDVYLLE